MRIKTSLGVLALSVWLILSGLMSFGFSFSNESVLLALLAIAAGVLLLLGK